MSLTNHIRLSGFNLDGENLFVEAIRAMQNEGTRADVADGFRDTGNELARAKSWKDAKEFYSKGIAVFLGENKWEKPEDPVKEAKRDRELEEACYINRALCNLELSMCCARGEHGEY